MQQSNEENLRIVVNSLADYTDQFTMNEIDFMRWLTKLRLQQLRKL